MIAWGRRDRGQAFPIYIVVITGMLFASLAFFVVGRGGVARSNAQGAADAAALAAAGEARDRVFLGLDLSGLTLEGWRQVAHGDLLTGRGACEEAVAFAARNGARADCQAEIPLVTVTATTDEAIGQSVVPGTEAMRGKATAKALIKPQCELRSAPQPAPTLTTPGPTPSPGPSQGAGSVSFMCDGKLLTVDLAKPGSLTQLARRLFTVRLVD
ncbi:pilus assembly protein TadG-related protein [Streptomyces sp. 2P-4]|uniref:pilus assembly protein TadG-related protein n=1 Tax=Streptomyces sp. 2P-4 TaxID=2931974 RepID=UPI002540D025|nr:pilus assembly protein TadG-related protein [Streptomyces sp. 2P-4]